MWRAPRPAGGRNRNSRWRVVLPIGGIALAAVVLMGLARDFGAGPSGRPPQPTAVVSTAEAPIIIAGKGSQTTDWFYLAGGTYRGDWSAWGAGPEYPPCTHSAQLVAIDPANGNTARGGVIDLAHLVEVPATGASSESYVYKVTPGDYYLDVASACAWQIALSPD